ncbi:MAG: hypothetical protein U5L76_02755 [Patescibacteria group bacterium]|nr:hypothetical protein [Patescibacteria group bacterium]
MFRTIWTIAVFFFLICLFFLVSAVADDLQVDDLKITTFARLDLPDKKIEDYRFAWGRIGIKFYPYSDILGQKIMVRTEFDYTTSSLKYLYVQFDRNYSGGQFNFLVGQYLCPVNLIWPGPRHNRLSRWPDAKADLPVSCAGTALWYSHGNWSVKAAHYNGGSTMTLGLYGLTGFYVQNTAHGVAWQHSFNYWFNPFVGLTRYEENIPGKESVFFVQNHIDFPKGLRLYGLYDFGDTENTWMVTLSWKYAPDSSIYISYDQRDEYVRSGVNFAY